MAIMLPHGQRLHDIELVGALGLFDDDLDDREPLWIDDLEQGGFASARGDEVYSEGDCWVLAWAVHQECRRRGINSRIVVLGIHPETEWDHVAVEVRAGDGANRYVDIRGAHTRSEIRGAWFGNRLVPVDRSIADGPFGTYKEHLGCGFMFDATFEDAMFVAARLLDSIEFSRMVETTAQTGTLSV